MLRSLTHSGDLALDSCLTEFVKPRLFWVFSDTIPQCQRGIGLSVMARIALSHGEFFSNFPDVVTLTRRDRPDGRDRWDEADEMRPTKGDRRDETDQMRRTKRDRPDGRDETDRTRQAKRDWIDSRDKADQMRRTRQTRQTEWTWQYCLTRHEAEVLSRWLVLFEEHNFRLNIH